MKNRKKGRKKKEEKRKNGYGENRERDVEGDEGCIDIQFDCSEVLWDSKMFWHCYQGSVA